MSKYIGYCWFIIGSAVNFLVLTKNPKAAYPPWDLKIVKNIELTLDYHISTHNLNLKNHQYVRLIPLLTVQSL